jgi:hypothetical protein
VEELQKSTNELKFISKNNEIIHLVYEKAKLAVIEPNTQVRGYALLDDLIKHDFIRELIHILSVECNTAGRPNV